MLWPDPEFASTGGLLMNVWSWRKKITVDWVFFFFFLIVFIPGRKRMVLIRHSDLNIAGGAAERVVEATSWRSSRTPLWTEARLQGRREEKDDEKRWKGRRVQFTGWCSEVEVSEETHGDFHTEQANEKWYLDEYLIMNKDNAQEWLITLYLEQTDRQTDR